MAEIKINGMVVSNDIITEINGYKKFEITYSDGEVDIFFVPTLPIEESEE